MKMKSEIIFNQQYFGGNAVKIGRVLAAFRKQMGAQ